MYAHLPIYRISILVVLLSSLLTTNFIIAGISYRGLLIMLIILALITPMALRMLQQRLDIFEPLVLANIALGVMFIGRPLADIATGMPIHLGYDISHTFDEALIVVLVGVVAFQFGYHSIFVTSMTRHFPAPTTFRPERAALAAWLFFALGAALFGIFLLKSGGLGLLFYLLQGRGSGNNELFLGASGYFYNGLLMWTASALMFFALASVYKRKIYYFLFGLTALLLIIYFGARGSRSQLLPLILSVPTFWYLWRARRPTAKTLLITAMIGIAFAGYIRETRTVYSGSERDMVETIVESLSSPIEQFADILTGADNEMFDSITNELLVVPSELGYRPGGTIADLFIRAIPKPFWGGTKPLETNDTIVNSLWPKHFSLSRASAAFSIIGPFYFDSGYVGVVVGMFMIGLILASSWRWYCCYSDNINATLIYSMGLPFVVILMRGTLPGTLYRMLFMVVPLLLAMWISRMTLQKNSGNNYAHTK